ncbi:MAG: NAD-dependent epimerase/dehydratase family protein [Hyphomicrobiales bacterium]
MKRILVTGASGFIGHALVAHLAEHGYRVRAASRRPPPRAGRVENVASPDLAGEADWVPFLAGVDAIVHAAALAHTGDADEAAYDAVNHRAVVALARAAQGRVERLVFLSSIRAQSGPAAAAMLTEADDPRPTDAYGRAKLAAEEALARLGATAVILRPVLVAGSQPRGNLAAMLRFAKLPLRFDGLTARRSLLARADLCAAVEHVLGDPRHIGETYIVAHPEPIGIGAMFAALREGLGRKRGLLSVPGPLLRAALGLPGLRDAKDRLFGDLVASPAKLMATGWPPQISAHAALVEIGRVGKSP